jgi:hypothetical protein
MIVTMMQPQIDAGQHRLNDRNLLNLCLSVAK